MRKLPGRNEEAVLERELVLGPTSSLHGVEPKCASYLLAITHRSTLRLMNSEDASKQLEKFLEYYERGLLLGIGDACLRLYELAALIEPEDLLSAIPELLRHELRKDASGPLMSREEYQPIEGVTVHPKNWESYSRERKAREDRQYEGLCRLHRYFATYASKKL